MLPGALRMIDELAAFRNFETSNFENYEDYIKQLPRKTSENQFHLSGSNDVWEQTKLVDMKFNRLLLYPAFVLHKAIFEEHWFGSALDERRLTLNFFFKFPRFREKFLTS